MIEYKNAACSKCKSNRKKLQIKLNKQKKIGPVWDLTFSLLREWLWSSELRQLRVFF